MNFARKIKRQNQIAESKIRGREYKKAKRKQDEEWRKKRQQEKLEDGWLREQVAKPVLLKNGKELTIQGKPITQSDILKALKEIGDNV